MTRLNEMGEAERVTIDKVQLHDLVLANSGQFESVMIKMTHLDENTFNEVINITYKVGSTVNHIVLTPQHYLFTKKDVFAHRPSRHAGVGERLVMIDGTLVEIIDIRITDAPTKDFF